MTNKKTILYLTLIIVGILLVIFSIYSFRVYRSLAEKDSAVKDHWSRIENQYQEKVVVLVDLIEITKKNTKKNEEVFTKAEQSRSSWLQAMESADIEAKIVAAKDLDDNISKVIQVADNYPDLKATEEYLQIQDKLKNAARVIATETEEYNNAVTEFNRKLKKFPENAVAILVRLESYSYFQESE